ADRRAAHVAHAAPQAPNHLKEDVAHRSLVRYAPLDPFRHELSWGELTALEIPVGAAVLHRRQTAHAAHHLEAAPLEEERLAGALLGSGEHRSHHHAGGAGGERL